MESLNSPVNRYDVVKLSVQLLHTKTISFEGRLQRVDYVLYVIDVALWAQGNRWTPCHSSNIPDLANAEEYESKEQ